MKQDWSKKKKKPMPSRNNGDGVGANEPGPWQDMGLR
jgi:hypothetical protein